MIPHFKRKEDFAWPQKGVRLHQLKEFSLSLSLLGNSTEHLRTFLKGCPYLACLKLTRSLVTSDVLCLLGQSCPRVRVLSLYRLETVAGRPLMCDFLTALGSLERLDLNTVAHCSFSTEFRCPTVRVFSLHARHLLVGSIHLLSTQFSALKQLYLETSSTASTPLPYVFRGLSQLGLLCIFDAHVDSMDERVLLNALCTDRALLPSLRLLFFQDHHSSLNDLAPISRLSSIRPWLSLRLLWACGTQQCGLCTRLVSETFRSDSLF
jgi:hypothetical protein